VTPLISRHRVRIHGGFHNMHVKKKCLHEYPHAPQSNKRKTPRLAIYLLSLRLVSSHHIYPSANLVNITTDKIYNNKVHTIDCMVCLPDQIPNHDSQLPTRTVIYRSCTMYLPRSFSSHRTPASSSTFSNNHVRRHLLHTPTFQTLV
jgi:hypothetical protein